ncbi:methyl-accepting chemotaxis protein [Aeromonas schubertii]|uniref:methyl-accepting chemotaxis protein n=1 Tax=Aeromonas schubertii TaxID=652 RepID=UPI001CC3D7B2|nr:methyl-accepting chemotaxis protein [Aeromonas schubertii]MBZ6071123.1 methyl-accepting chemotaxis protein [Aeromonas schubertii]
MEQTKSTFQVNLLISVVLLLLLALTFIAYIWSSARIQEASELRYHSYQLADELRQSSDDLTRLARTYVITKDPAYEQQYMRILAIRNGEAARPQDYHRIYWDFVAATGQPPRPDSGERRGLIELMKDAGFTSQELAKLTEAKNNSDGLVNTEVAAFKLVQQSDGDPVANQQQAIAMMHDKAYHQNKAKIMEPIDQFYVLLDNRTQEAVEGAASLSQLIGYLFILLGVALMFFLWRTYRSLLELVGSPVQVLRRELEHMARGDFSRAIEVPANARYSLIGMLAEMQKTLRDIIGKVSHSAQSLMQSADNIAMTAEQTSHYAASQQGSTQTMAAAIEQLVVSITHLSDNASNADQLSKDAATALDQGSAVINQTLDSIESISSTVTDAATSIAELNTHTQQISEIIEVIRGIAEQTNLLALNAAIEAARAGDQGRGFAVVADEVRNLASRSAASTQQITGMIQKIQGGTDSSIRNMEAAVNNVSRGVSLANQTGEAITSIKSNAANLTGLMGEISHTLREQSVAANEVASTVGTITSLSEQSRDAARNSAQEAERLQRLSRELETEMTHFRLR